MADLLFPMIRTDRFVFDVEVVYLALRFNCSLKRLPVTPGSLTDVSTVRPLMDSVRSFGDLMRIKRRARARAYESEPLRALVNAPLRKRLSDMRERVAEPSADNDSPC